MSSVPPPVACAGCGLALSPGFLSCPACHRLVYGDRLSALATEAEAAARRSDLVAALAAWREALSLLPPQARQHAVIEQRVRDLSSRIDGTPAAEGRGSSNLARGALASLGVLGLLLAKLKWPLLFLLGKGKLLLGGLTQASTFFSMLLSFGVYWTAFGWKLALGLVVLLYVHEIGHVAAFTRYGIPVSAPMFVPGFGAFVRGRYRPASVVEDARIGLAGPVWGTGGVVAVWGAALALSSDLLSAIAHFGAVINLLNLAPVWGLDGASGFRALDRAQRAIVTAALIAAGVWTHEGLLVVIALIAGFRTVAETPAEGDGVACAEFVGLIVVLAALSGLSVVPTR